MVSWTGRKIRGNRGRRGLWPVGRRGALRESESFFRSIIVDDGLVDDESGAIENGLAKVYLLKWHDEGQLSYEPLVRPQPHTDAVVRGCETWLRERFRQAGVVARAVGHAQIPERTLKRRFRQATGRALIDYVQNLRIEDIEGCRPCHTGDERDPECQVDSGIDRAGERTWSVPGQLQ